MGSGTLSWIVAASAIFAPLSVRQYKRANRSQRPLRTRRDRAFDGARVGGSAAPSRDD